MLKTSKKEKLTMELWIEVYSTKISNGVSHLGATMCADEAVKAFKSKFEIA